MTKWHVRHLFKQRQRQLFDSIHRGDADSAYWLTIIVLHYLKQITKSHAVIQTQ